MFIFWTWQWLTWRHWCWPCPVNCIRCGISIHGSSVTSSATSRLWFRRPSPTPLSSQSWHSLLRGEHSSTIFSFSQEWHFADILPFVDHSHLSPTPLLARLRRWSSRSGWSVSSPQRPGPCSPRSTISSTRERSLRSPPGAASPSTKRTSRVSTWCSSQQSSTSSFPCSLSWSCTSGNDKKIFHKNYFTFVSLESGWVWTTPRWWGATEADKMEPIIRLVMIAPESKRKISEEFRNIIN